MARRSKSVTGSMNPTSRNVSLDALVDDDDRAADQFASAITEMQMDANQTAQAEQENIDMSTIMDTDPIIDLTEGVMEVVDLSLNEFSGNHDSAGLGPNKVPHATITKPIGTKSAATGASGVSPTNRRTRMDETAERAERNASLRRDAEALALKQQAIRQVTPPVAKKQGKGEVKVAAPKPPKQGVCIFSGQPTGGGSFRPGYDAKLKSALIKAFRGQTPDLSAASPQMKARFANGDLSTPEGILAFAATRQWDQYMTVATKTATDRAAKAQTKADPTTVIEDQLRKLGLSEVAIATALDYITDLIEEEADDEAAATGLSEEVVVANAEAEVADEDDTDTDDEDDSDED